MAKKKKENLVSNSEIDVDSLRVMEYKDFLVLKRYFEKTRAKSSFWVKFGSFILLILALPALFLAYYLLVVAVLSVVEAFGKDAVVMTDSIFQTYFANVWNHMFVTQLGAGWMQIPEIASIDSYKIDSIIFLVVTSIWALIFSLAFLTNFTLMISRRNNKSSTILSNIFLLLPMIYIFGLYLIALPETIFTDSASFTINSDLTHYVSYGLMGAGVVFGILPIMFGKYKLQITVSY